MQLDALDPIGTASEADDGRATSVPAGLAIIDGDIHPAMQSAADLSPYLSARWREHWQSYGSRRRHGMSFEPYPKSAPRACRRDAWPESGMPGSDLALMQRQHLDHYGVAVGLLGPLGITGQGELNLDFAAALASATNDWQRDAWCRREPRLKGGIVVSYEDAAAAVAEIERCGADPHFAQIFLLSRSQEPLGNRRYWPIYAAAERYDLPVAIHVFGAGGHPFTGTGWPSYYIEEGAGHSTSCQTAITSLVVEGVFERHPRLKVVMVEGGFGWLPALAWRLDQLYQRMRGEVPHLRRRPSEYIREHIWLTTQPMEEPDERRHLAEIIDWIGPDRLLFSSDYPHWDFDDPFRAFPAGIDAETKRRIMTENGRAVYRLD